MYRLCGFILLAWTIWAPTAGAATLAGEAFSLGAGGRGLALGGAVIAGPFDATAPYWNPAGMNRLSGGHIVAMHAETFGSLLDQDFVGYVHGRPQANSFLQSFGFYLYYLGGGGIKLTRFDADLGRPVVVREESHGDYLLSAAISGSIGQKIDIGFTAKFIYRDIGTENGQGLTIDGGALWQANQFTNVGLMITDLTTGFIRYSGGTTIEGRDTTFVTKSNTESIYPTVKPGLQITHTHHDFTGRLLMSGDIRFENLKTVAQYWSGSLSLDTHYGLEISYREAIFGRTGFDIGRFTAGGGVSLSRVTVDFAYLHHSDLDESFRVSAGYRL